MSELRQTGHLVVLSGPSGVGKGTLIECLQRMRQDLAFSVSCTTRQPREGERHGVHYFFLTEDEFQQRLDEGDFLEHAGYADHAYGTSRSQVESLLAAGKTVLLDIEVQGAMQVRALRPDATLIYLLPPSYQELRQRLYGRNTEPGDVVEKRLARAREERDMIPQYEYIVVNDQVERAAQELNSILNALDQKECNMQQAVEAYCRSFQE
jgi:guanylate kinase